MFDVLSSTVRASAVCAVLAASAAWADVITFQNGLNGYAGNEEVSLVTSSVGGAPAGTVNTGAWDAFQVNTADVRPGLIRFKDLFGNGPNQVPVGATINSATMRLYQFSNQGATQIRAYPMLTDWTEGNSSPGGAFATAQAGESTLQARHYRADQNYAANAGDAWGTDGAIHTGPVRKDLAGGGNGWDWALDDARNAVINIGTTNNVWDEWDLTAVVKDWQDGDLGNYGVYLTAASTLSTGFRASEYTTDSTLRPMLVINFTPPAPEPASGLLIGGAGLLCLRRAR